MTERPATQGMLCQVRTAPELPSDAATIGEITTALLRSLMPVYSAASRVSGRWTNTTVHEAATSLSTTVDGKPCKIDAAITYLDWATAHCQVGVIYGDQNLAHTNDFPLASALARSLSEAISPEVHDDKLKFSVRINALV